ncbi:hypothetical protein BGZ72_004131 [Mortierella alpina]|nr:hypothetical protein BGZ72_004131 [Mortierella alpina]
MHPTSAFTLAGLALFLMSMCTATSDVFLSTFGHSVRFKLDRNALSSSQLAARSILEPCGTDKRFAMEPFVDVPLTGIPKDYGYTATFSIGTYDRAGQDRLCHLLIDTGSDLVVVMSEECTDPECLKVPDRFNCSASLTCTPVSNALTGGERAIQRYGDGTKAEGRLIQDTIRFVSSNPMNLPDLSSPADPITTPGTALELLDQPMLLVDQPGLRLFKSYGSAVDGILGLNLGSPVINKTVIQNLRHPTTLSNLPASAFCPSDSCSSLDNTLLLHDSTTVSIGFMSLWLGHSYEPGQGGEMLLNAVDRSRFRGPVHWTDRGPSPYDWTVPLDKGVWLLDPLSGKEEVPLVGSELTFAVIDSGSDGIYLQRPLYDALFQSVPGARQLAEKGYWRVPCEGTVELVFGIQGEVYRIPYADWVKKPTTTTTTKEDESAMAGGVKMCQSRVYGSSPGPILLGSTFLRTVYTILDFSRPGQERVGLARLA